MVDHWKALANRLGTPGIDEPVQKETPAAKPMNESTAAPKPSFEAKPLETKPVVEPVLPPLVFEEEPAAAAEAEKPAKRRKSSWETLASLFNVAVERYEGPVNPPAEEAPKAKPPQPKASTPAEPTPSSSEKVLDFFKPTAAASTPLDDMFDSIKEPLKLEGWGKPKRVVDDVSWDADEVDDADDEPAEPDVEAKREPIEEEAGEGDEEPARRRRRRRRGRRGRTRDDVAATDKVDDEFESDELSDGRELPVAWKADTLDIESAGPWAEPDTFESEAPASELDDESEGEVLRRSSRRRRRRGRDRDDEGREVRSERTSEPSSERALPSDRHPDRDRDRSDRERPSERTSERSERPSRSSRGEHRSVEKPIARKPVDEDFLDVDDVFEPLGEVREREPRRERDSDREEGRKPRTRRPVDSPARSNRNAEEIDDDDAGLEDDDNGAEAGAKQHRNIPTWLDALDTLIQANMDNHKRNEGRGGRSGGGRPRGRR